MNFGDTIKYIKEGWKCRREGWNGRGMFIVYQPGYPEGIQCNENMAKAWGISVGDIVKIQPYMQLRTSDGTYQMWVPSTSDVLADDWRVIC